jgi:hypothetical protein
MTLTVKELMEKLADKDPNLRVVIDIHANDCYLPADYVGVDRLTVETEWQGEPSSYFPDGDENGEEVLVIS